MEAARLRQIRDAVLRYTYEHGAGHVQWAVTHEQIERDLKISKHELREVLAVLRNQQLLGPSSLSSVGLNVAGQHEAEAMGVSDPLRDAQKLASIQIDASHSIVQVAGAGSSQNASLVNLSNIVTVIDEIERALPNLAIQDRERQKASELIASLRTAITEKMPGAAIVAIGAGLASILTGAGSELGKRLVDAIAGCFG